MILPETFGEEKNTINVVIETPKGSRDKYDYEPDKDYFKLDKTLPAGAVFPFDFGFIPNTIAPDGDPLDVIVIMESRSYPGCVVECRSIGIMQAEQKEKKQPRYRNDRIIAVANASFIYSRLESYKDLNEYLLEDFVHFFKYYNKIEGKRFELLGIKGADTALKLIKKHIVK